MGTFKKGGEPIKTTQEYQTRLLEVMQQELDRRALQISQLKEDFDKRTADIEKLLDEIESLKKQIR